LNSAAVDDRLAKRAMTSLQLASSEADVLQETLLGEALEHAPVGALVLDEQGRYLAANRMACRLTGYAREELLRLTPTDLAAHPANVPAKLAELAEGRPLSGQTQLRRQDGAVVSVAYRAGETRSGGLPYFVLVFWEDAS
jgi:PAS domain S-box-containing protein